MDNQDSADLRNKEFQILEKQMQAQIIEFNSSNTRSILDLTEKQNSNQNAISEFGILIRITSHPGFLKKIKSLFKVSFLISQISRKLNQQGYEVLAKYGVYPTVVDPVAIFELSSRAETYTNKMILPAFSSGLNGRLRRMIAQIIGFHPSIDGVVIMVRK